MRPVSASSTTPDVALFGSDDTPRIVAVQGLRGVPDAEQAMVRVYQRSADGQRVTHSDEPLHPFFFLSDAALLRGFPRGRFLIQELDGANPYRYLVVFHTWGAYWDAIRRVERATDSRERRPEEIYFVSGAEMQYLMQTGRTCFKGMTFDDLHRMQLDIEVTSDGSFPNAERPDDAIIIVSMTDNRGWSHLIEGRAKSEAEMLREVVDVIQAQDPDVIEGHNCFPPGTRVLTPSGPRAIETLTPGTPIVAGPNLQPDCVHQVHHRPYDGDLIRIRAQYRSAVTSTPEHPHYGYTAASGLGWHQAAQFQKGDYLAMPRRQLDDLQFDEDAYLAGLVYADGHLAKASNRVSFGNTDPVLIECVRSRIAGHHRTVERPNADGQRPLFRIFTHDVTFRELLTSYGVPVGGKSSSDSRVSLAPVFDRGPSAVASFLCGLIDGDGHVTEAGIIHIASKPDASKQAIAGMALHLGLQASVVPNGVYIYPSLRTSETLHFIACHLRSAHKRRRLQVEQQRAYAVSGSYDHLPPCVIDWIRPIVTQLGLRYADFPLPTTTVNYLLNKRTSVRRHTFDRLVQTIESHLSPALAEEWTEVRHKLDAVDGFFWFRVIESDRIAYRGPVYNIGTGSHTYVADGILTHNCYSFDFPYLMTRCERHRVPFAIGRDGSVPRSFPSSMRFAERTIDYPALEIAGRHVVDTLFQVMSFDVFKRDLPGYGLKQAAQYFGFAPEGRTYVAGDAIARTWREDPERLLKYALDDVIETERLARHLSGSTFYLTQMLPMPYGHVARTGPATKIEALFVREYLRQRHSVPKSEWGSQTMGGYTDIFVTGVVGPVVYADVESLYPSIMLNYDVQPRDDALDLFPTLLRRLTDLRFDAKRKMKEAPSDDLRSELDARQTSYKNLINSFYGTLGFGLAVFNDFAEADRVAATGQDILRQIIALIRKAGGQVIEVDTDGVLFVPPDGVRGEAAERAFVEQMNEAMPEGIRIGFDGRFQRMMSYKKKNYALLRYDGTLKFKGSSLVSRSTERFGRQFVRKAIRLLLDEDIQGLHDLYLATRDRILAHDWKQAASFSRTETLKDTPKQYLADVEAGKRTRAASYELALQRAASGGPPVRKGDRITYYVTGTTATVTTFENSAFADAWDPDDPDENTAYYLKRLDEFARKFELFFSEHDFRLVFSPEDLFGFSPAGIELQSTERVPEEDDADEVPF